MENTTQFDLNEAIARWRENLAASPVVSADQLDELEVHLRDSVRALQAKGLAEEEACLLAARRLGNSTELACEFGKVNRPLVWRWRAVWMLAGMVVYSAAADLCRAFGMGAMFLGSAFTSNGYLLGWLGVAAKCGVVASVGWAFYAVAKGGLGSGAARSARILRNRVLAASALFALLLGLKVAGVLSVVALVRVLPPHSLGIAFALNQWLAQVGPLVLLFIFILGLLRVMPAERRAQKLT